MIDIDARWQTYGCSSARDARARARASFLPHYATMMPLTIAEGRQYRRDAFATARAFMRAMLIASILAPRQR